MTDGQQKGEKMDGKDRKFGKREMGKREEIIHTKQGGANVNDNIGRSSLLPSQNDSHDIVYQLFRSMTACMWKLLPVGGEQN